MSRLYTICAFTENSPGVLQRITILFTKRKINIESLTVSETERKGISRFTIVVECERDLIEKIAKQIARIIEVVDVFATENGSLIYKELAFFKVATSLPEKRIELEELAHRYGATVNQAKKDYLVIERAGTEEQIDSLYLLLQPYGVLEFIRSGRIAILNRQRSEGEIVLTEN